MKLLPCILLFLALFNLNSHRTIAYPAQTYSYSPPVYTTYYAPPVYSYYSPIIVPYYAPYSPYYYDSLYWNLDGADAAEISFKALLITAILTLSFIAIDSISR